MFGNDGEVGTEGIGISACHFYAANIGRDHREIAIGSRALFAQVANEGGFGVEVIDGDIKKSLDLWGVKIHGNQAIDTGFREHIGDEFRGDGDAGLVLAVLARVSEKRHHGIDAAGAGTACGIDHDQQLHDIMIRGGAGGLDDKDIFPADVFIDFDKSFTIGEGGDVHVGQRRADVFCNSLC